MPQDGIDVRRAARNGDDFGPGPDASDVIGTRSDAAPADREDQQHNRFGLLGTGSSLPRFEPRACRQHQ